MQEMFSSSWSLKLNKDRLLFCFLVTCLLLTMFQSKRLYFTWGIPTSLLSVMTVISCICIISHYRKNYRYVSTSEILFLCLVFLLYSYEFINVGELSLLSLLFHINVAFIAAFLIMSKVELKERISNNCCDFLIWLDTLFTSISFATLFFTNRFFLFS